MVYSDGRRRNCRFQITQNFCEFIISFLKGLDLFRIEFFPACFQCGFSAGEMKLEVCHHYIIVRIVTMTFS